MDRPVHEAVAAADAAERYIPQLDVPLGLQEDFAVEASLMATTSPFKLVQRLQAMKAGTTPPEQENSFKFALPPQTSFGTAPGVDGFPFLAAGASKSTVGSVSLKSWSKDDPSSQEPSKPDGAADAADESTSDSFALRPPLDPAVQRTAETDPNVESPTTPRTRNLDSAESMPFLSWKAKFTNWRLGRRRRTVGNVRELPMRTGGVPPIIEGLRGRSAEWLESASDFSQADRSRRSNASKGNINELLQSMPDAFPTTPRSAEGCSSCKSPEFAYRLYPFSKFFGNLPNVQFPSSPTGRTYVLDSAAFRNVSAFNGNWRMEKGGKDLYKAQVAFLQTKKIPHRFDGHIRYLVINSTAQHFRLATWTTMYECREQRPWNGEPVYGRTGRGNKQEPKMSVELKSEKIIAHTEWMPPKDGTLHEVYRLSPDRLTLSLIVTMEQKRVNHRTGTRTSMVHTVVFRRL